jgi:hypothetical protein
MPYLHEVYVQNGNYFMNHDRMTTQRSGLIAIEVLARSFPIMAPPDRQRPPANMLIARSIADPQEPKDAGVELFDHNQVECPGLPEFVEQGIARWQHLAKLLRRVNSINLELAKEVTMTDQTTPGGVVLPRPPEVSFVGYSATPGEIEALESMEWQIKAELNKAHTSAAPARADANGGYL